MISMIFLSKVFLLSIAKLSLIFSLACFISAETSGIAAFSSPSTTLRGCLFLVFRHFLLAFGRSKNWMASKVRSWKHLSMNFSASRFWGNLTFGSPGSYFTKVTKSSNKHPLSTIKSGAEALRQSSMLFQNSIESTMSCIS
jgi:hypothetical protein